ncbi:MAG: PAS domain S-box protein, partial [Candidatus Angelobacter sp.]
DGFMLTSPDGAIHAANPSACRIFGRTEQEICQAGREGLIDMSDPRLQVLVEERGRTGKAQGELSAKRTDGTLFPVEVASVAFKDTNGEIRTSLALRDISARKQAEQKLKEQAALLELAHDAVIVRDPQAHVVFWNRGAKDIYGWSAEEALGRISHELLQSIFPMPLQEIETIVKERGQWEGELVHRTRAGKTIVVASRWSLLRDEDGAPRSILEINRDITARKHAEAELKIQTERLSLATRAASIGVWDLDLRTKLTVWDDTLFEMFGIPRVVPMPYESWARLVHPDDLPNAEASLERTIRLKTQDYVEFRIIRPDGSLRHISSAQGLVLDEHGNPIRIVGVGTDITERKRMEAQLASTARLSALGMMAGGVAHEINNPLAIIHASASDLLDTAKEEGQVPVEVVVRTATRIRQTADRIAKIVKSMRRIARDGSQDPFLSVPVSKIVEQTLEVCQAKFKDQSVTLRLPALDPDLQIACREVQISQVLLNLLTNALDAVADQPGEKWVRMNVERRDESIVLSVVDSGLGVAPELKGRIMEPFFTTKEVGKGTGLGLSLSRAIAEEHGGRLEVTEDHGHTCFSLTLPVSRKAESLCNSKMQLF